MSGATAASFGYDAFNRRTGKTIAGATTGFVYDGDNFVQELNGLVNTSTVRSNLLSGDIDQIFMRSVNGTGSAALSWFLPDATNNTMFLTDGVSTAKQLYGYEPYGRAKSYFSGDTNTQQFTARENDGTGLYYYRNRYYMPSCARFISEDPIGWASGQTNNYAYVGGDPVQFGDPSGQLSQGVVDFAAGFGDAVSFGLTGDIRNWMDIGSVDQCSGSYSAGEWTGVAWGVAMGGAAGWRSAEKQAGTEFSHWIPNRWGGPRSLWNGNFVSAEEHALSDPYRYRFMPRDWKASNPMPNPAIQQWNRMPNVYKGAAGGGGLMGVSVGSSSGGGCN